MSPASSGSLEIEKYIGACLISSQHTRNKNNQKQQQINRDVYYQQREIYNGNYITYRSNNSDGWAGGMPLISFANHQQRRATTRRPDEPSRCSSPRVITEDAGNLSRLAVHTQGLPLILAGRNGHGNRRTKTNNHFNNRNVPIPIQIPIQSQGRGVVESTTSTKKIGECKDNQGIDTLSVASDESSGSSNHSETSLPRIIKPRKRRKKDRKPHGRVALERSDSNSVNSDYFNPNHQYYSDKFVSASISDLNDSPQLHHRFEDVLHNLEIELDDNYELSNCQCRYCDPAGQIWDVDKHCYSPFLTVPPFKTQLSSDSSISSSSTDSSISTDSTNSRHLTDIISSLISTFSLDLEDTDLGKTPHQDVCKSNRVQQHQQCLEISTEIVTSPNGHRDLEIRLFSSDKLTIKPNDSDANLQSEE